MSSLWRVLWNLKGTNGPQQKMEFTYEQKALQWAQEMLKHGANGIWVNELILGKSTRIDSNSYVLPLNTESPQINREEGF